MELGLSMFLFIYAFRKVIILDSSLIKTGKQMREMSQRLQTNITGLERHSTLIQYYNQSSYARVTAVRWVNNTLIFFKESE